MNEKGEFALVPRSPSAVAKAQPGAMRILSSMVADTLALVPKEKVVPPPGKFRIGDYEWCEPDYRQIILWAKALRIKPEQVIGRLMTAHDDSDRLLDAIFDPDFYDTPPDCFQGGRLISLDLENWSTNRFNWVEGLQLEGLSVNYCRNLISKSPQKLPHKIASLSFPLSSLTYLALGCISTSAMDLANLTNLKKLKLRGTTWKKLTLPSADVMESFSCLNYRRIDIGFFLERFPQIRSLEFAFNGIETLALPNLPRLERLLCNTNKLTHLDLSQDHQITNLSCPNNRLSDLQLPNMPLLKSLNCSSNLLNELDLSANLSLVKLDCSRNQISKLQINHLANLTELRCAKNGILELDIRHLQHLETLTYDVANTKLLQRSDQNF